jgi:hypothetical protein
MSDVEPPSDAEVEAAARVLYDLEAITVGGPAVCPTTSSM